MYVYNPKGIYFYLKCTLADKSPERVLDECDTLCNIVLIQDSATRRNNYGTNIINAPYELTIECVFCRHDS